MDNRKTLIRELEEKKLSCTEARNRLLEGLGAILFQRIDDGEPGGNPFEEKSGVTPGAVLADYRKLQSETAESIKTIGSLEAETERLRELEAAISAKENEKSALEKEIAEARTRLGKALLLTPGSEDFAGPLKQREELLLARILEREEKLEDSEGQGSGVFAWIGNNARKAVSKTILLKDRTSLEKLYRETGEKFLSSEPGAGGEPESSAGEDAAGASSPEITEAREKAGELGGRLASINGELSGLKAERRKIVELFGAEGSPVKRIQALEKHIVHVKGEFPGVYRRFAGFAAKEGGRESLSAFLREEDRPVLEKAALLETEIAEKELAVEKLKAAISIDNEKAEIQRVNKAIAGQREKIASAEKAISDMEKQISESEQRIAELNAFLPESE